jgi:hypothetical protein
MGPAAGSRGISAAGLGRALFFPSDSAHATQGPPVPSAKGISQTGTRFNPNPIQKLEAIS